MKHSAIIALIVCGTVLVSIPYIHNIAVMTQLTNTMVQLERPVNLTADLPKHAGTVCMFGGFAMIVAGAIAGFGPEKSK